MEEMRKQVAHEKERLIHVNRKYKSTVFELLFKDKRKLLELYNGLNGTDYANPDEIEIYTLENAIYMGKKNDVSFILASELNLYEHQSTYNPNIPLRSLFYIASQLEKYVKDESIYSSTMIKIPTPRFVVFYNGTQKQKERKELKLSDAYEKQIDHVELELRVMMLNINQGNNKELMEKCRTLEEYSRFIALIRTYVGEMTIEEAVNKAVEECIEKDVLREFLSDQKAEVIAMSILEYNEEKEMKKLRQSEFRHGEERGIEKGESLLSELTSKLLEESRLQELKKAMKDSGYRKVLYQEYGIGMVNEEEADYTSTIKK